LLALQQVDPAGGPAPGVHNWYRGGPLLTYDRQMIDAVGSLDNSDAIREVWRAALAARWDGRPVWFHGDVAAGNLLVADGKLSAVIDFGTCGVGDPACDLAIAWTLLSGSSRETFRRRLSVDPAMWLRGQGWALWKAVITASGTGAVQAKHVIDEILAAFVVPRG
jgi:aminoglycoside phosphotransferase (APT) family kinase protein